MKNTVQDIVIPHFKGMNFEIYNRRGGFSHIGKLSRIKNDNYYFTTKNNNSKWLVKTEVRSRFIPKDNTIQELEKLGYTPRLSFDNFTLCIITPTDIGVEERKKVRSICNWVNTYTDTEVQVCECCDVLVNKQQQHFNEDSKVYCNDCAFTVSSSVIQRQCNERIKDVRRFFNMPKYM